MTIQTLFKSTQLSSNYIFLDGSIASFVRGRYSTDDPARIKQLENEIATKHPYIYKDAKEATIDTEKLDPMWKLKQDMRAQILEEMAAAQDPSRDMGSYAPTHLSPSSTTDIAPVAAGAGPSTAVQALLARTRAAKAAEALATKSDDSAPETLPQEVAKTE
jgi:small-conductance mechanosensitive channel